MEIHYNVVYVHSVHIYLYNDISPCDTDDCADVCACLRFQASENIVCAFS